MTVSPTACNPIEDGIGKGIGRGFLGFLGWGSVYKPFADDKADKLSKELQKSQQLTTVSIGNLLRIESADIEAELANLQAILSLSHTRQSEISQKITQTFTEFQVMEGMTTVILLITILFFCITK